MGNLNFKSPNDRSIFEQIRIFARKFFLFWTAVKIPQKNRLFCRHNRHFFRLVYTFTHIYTKYTKYVQRFYLSFLPGAREFWGFSRHSARAESTVGNRRLELGGRDNLIRF